VPPFLLLAKFASEGAASITTFGRRRTSLSEIINDAEEKVSSFAQTTDQRRCICNADL
jgi:hypothetical protein